MSRENANISTCTTVLLTSIISIVLRIKDVYLSMHAPYSQFNKNKL